MAVILPVVFVVADGEVLLFLHAEYVGQLDEMAVGLMAAGLTHTDDAAAVIDKLLDGGGDHGIAPPFSAGLCRIRIAHVDDHVDVLENIRILQNIVKTDELHIEGSAGQRFDHAEVGIILFIVQGMMHHMVAPGTHFAPAVQYRNPLHAVRGGSLHVLIQLAELRAYGFHIIHKFRELHGQLQISAIADAVHGLSQDGTSCRHPVDLRLLHRITALVEGIREEIRKKSSFRILHAFNIADQAQGGSISYASHHSVQADGLEFVHKRLRADPVIAQEHHGLFAAFMADIHHFLRDLRYLSALERLEVLKLFGRNPVLVIVVSLVNDILRAERITHFLFKLLQNIRAYRCGIAIPFHVFFPGQLVEHQRELVEESSEAKYVHVRMLLNEFAQALHRIFVGLGLAHVEGDLMLHVLPVIHHSVVHMYRVPHDIGEEAHRIIMEGHAL